MAEVPLSTTVTELKRRISDYTVDRLKSIIQAFNEHCGSQLSRSGKKAELQDKLRQQLDLWEVVQSMASISTAKKVLDHVDSHGQYIPSELVNILHSSPLMAKPSKPLPAAQNSNYPYQSHVNGSGPSNGHYHPPPPSKPALNGIQFKSSPFFHVEQHVSGITQCPESTHMHDRKVINFDFSMTPEQREKLQDPKYQLRMYCTSSAFYTLPTTFRPTPQNVEAPIEFPNTCEIRVNNINLHAQTKGLKKKPGTAPPANLGTAVRTTASAINRVEMIYCNNNPTQGQPPNNRKYYLQINLVKITAAQELVDRLKKGKYRSKEIISVGMKQNVSYDDDIVAGPQKIPLKCPISYTRIETPCRSSKCVHASCFDAISWYSMMEITSTWQCPICENTLNLEDLIIDGYFDEILRVTDEDTEEVYVEADGEWHSLDDKYHSPGWVPPVKISDDSTSAQKRNSASSDTTAKPSTPLYDVKPKVDDDALKLPGVHQLVKPTEEIVLESDDDDDDVRVRREIIPITSSPAGRGSASVEDVIDLTLESDEEDTPLASRLAAPRPPVPVPAQQIQLNPTKRKASYDEAADVHHSPGSSYSKRPRLDEPRSPTYSTSGSTFSAYPPAFPSGASSSSTSNVLPPTNYRSTMSTNHLPALHVPSGGYRSGPNSASSNMLSPLMMPSSTGGRPAPLPSSTSTPSLSLPVHANLPPRPTWGSSSSSRDYRRDGGYGERSGW